MGMKEIYEIPGKNWLILKWLYLWNRLTDFDGLTSGRNLLMSTFILDDSRPIDPHNRRNTAATSFGQHCRLCYSMLFRIKYWTV